MLYQSLLTLLDTEFVNCKTNKTSATESGLTISVERLKDEKICFFHLDCESARKILRMPANEQKCCDYFILYIKSNKKDVICFLELKGKHFEEAVKQVTAAYKFTKKFLEQHLEKKLHADIRYCVSICMHGRSPSPKADLRGREQLKKEFGSDQRIEIKHGISNKYDLGAFLRKVHNS